MSPSDLIQLFLNQSLAGAIMLVGIFMTLLGAGATIGKINIDSDKWRTFCAALGIPTLLLGTVLAVLQLYKTVFGIELTPPDWHKVALFLSQESPAILTIMAITTVLWFAWWLINEKAYALDGILVNSDNDKANIRVEHKGGKPFYCIAKLDRIIKIGEDGDQDLDINAVNPDGSLFTWGHMSEVGYIGQGSPQIVNIFGLVSDPHYETTDLRLMFYPKHSQELDQEFDYRIYITLYRKKRRRHIPMKTIGGLLTVGLGGLAWGSIKESTN